MNRLVAAGWVRREQGRGDSVAARPRGWLVDRLVALWGSGRSAALNRKRVPGISSGAERPTIGVPALPGAALPRAGVLGGVVLAVEEVVGAGGGWTWRVWVSVARAVGRRGGLAVVVRARDLAEAGVDILPAGMQLMVQGDRTSASLVDRLAPRAAVVLGRTRGDSFWNVMDVDWSAAIDEAVGRLGLCQEDQVLLLRDAQVIAEDERRWFAHLMSALARAGLGRDRICVIDSGAHEGAGYLAVRRHLRGGGRPTAIFAGGDLAAAGACRALRCGGMDMSGLRVVGRGGTRVAQYARPRLTSLTPPIASLAQQALDRLLAPAGPPAPLLVLPARCVARDRAKTRLQ